MAEMSRMPTAQEMDAIYREAILAACVRATAIIKLRTSRGIGIDGSEFEEYSSSYAYKKGSSGRESEPVNFTVTGELLNGLKVLRVESADLGYIGWGPDVHPNYQFVQGRKRKGKTERSKAAAHSPYHLELLPTTTPIEQIVRGLSERRPFFGITQPAELEKLYRSYQRALDAGLERLAASMPDSAE